MKRSIYGLLCFLSVAFLFSSCQKKDSDAYYERPADLAPPIYLQLQAKGNFTNLLAVIDKAGYKDILGKSGSWTLFAPNDAAFQKYFTERGIPGVDSINAVEARKIALYGLVYNPFRKDQLTSNQTSLGAIPNTAYRRQTAYYDFVYVDAASGKKVVDNGLNGTNPVLYFPTINNNKFLPYFIDSYFGLNGLTSAGDYTPFYPGQTMSGFDVAGAKVIQADIPAENGIIHEIDKVLLPLPNVDQYLASKPAYSEFKKLLDKLVLLTPNATLTQRYNILTGSADPVFLRTYNAGLAFSPSNENLFSVSTDSQVSSWTIAVPTDEELKAYTKDLLENYNGSFDAAPPSVLLNFLNSHMWISTVWPSRLTQDPNSQKEPATFSQSNVIERKVLSNANFYGTNKVQEANVFRTVYRHLYLNPNYSLMTINVNSSDLRAATTTPTQKYTLFLLSDADLQAAGYFYNADLPGWGYTPGNLKAGDVFALNRINRLVQTSVLNTPFGEFDDLSGEGVAEAYNGEYVKFKANKIQASGNVVDNTNVSVTGSKNSVNGRVYYTSGGILKFAEDAVTVATSLEKLKSSTDPAINSKFSHFYNYLIGSSVYNATTKSIIGMEPGSLNTVLVPTNLAIENAVKAGILPGNTITGVPSASTSWSASQKTAVANFILFSVITKTTVAVDGKKPGSYPTLLKNANGDSRLLMVRYTTAGNNPPANTFQVLDDATVPTVTDANFSFSNNLSNRALIHSINAVLKF